MNSKSLNQNAKEVILGYSNFQIGKALCSVPYFNNKTQNKRAAFKVFIGKGNLKEISEEVEGLILKNKMNKESLSNESLKHILVDNQIGIDCSGFAFHVLEAESEERKMGSILKHLKFVNCDGIFGKLRCSLRPIENCDVSTLADDSNSKLVPLSQVLPGDFITMQGGVEKDEKDHILVIDSVSHKDEKGEVPDKIHFYHAVSYPEDGLYGNGIKQGEIEVKDLSQPLTLQKWSDNVIFNRALKSKTELRRFIWF